MWVWLVVQVASAWCRSTVDTTPSGTESTLEWPTGVAPTDTIVVLRIRRPSEVTLLDPAGAPVAFTRYDLPPVEPELVVLVPDAPLAPGAGYTVSTDPYDVHDFAVGSDVAPVGAAPVPATREMGAELTWTDADCPEDAFTESWLRYRLCNPPVVGLVTIAQVEPPAPTLGDPGDLAPFAGDRVEIEEGLAADLAGTAWLGGFDAAGRFTGWTADPFVLPSAGTRTSERAEGASGGTSTTPTAFLTCPAAAVWALETNATCEVWDLDTRDCFDAGASDTGGPPAPGKSGCGCAATSHGGGVGGPVVLLGLALAGLRRGRHVRR